jgi:DNA-binding transcriptional ArsR family regulator
MAKKAFNKTKKQPLKKRGVVSSAMRRLAERSLEIAPEDVRDYNPREIDYEIAEVMAAGVSGSFAAIAEALEKSPGVVSQALRDPLSCAWIADQVHRTVHYRKGLVDASLVRRALQGDVRAIELYYKMYGKLIEKKVHAHVSFGDVTKFTDADLDRLVEAEARRDVSSDRPAEGSVIDVTPAEPSTPTSDEETSS